MAGFIVDLSGYEQRQTTCTGHRNAHVHLCRRLNRQKESSVLGRSCSPSFSSEGD
jgi:hypothetical protein